MNKREVGAQRERQAAEFLTKNGMRIVDRNFCCRQGEIDLVGYHQGFLVFVEVKYRSGAEKGNALEAVDCRKQYRICRVADYYRYTHGLGDDTSVRYDVIGIQGPEVQWVQNAFPHIYRRR